MIEFIKPIRYGILIGLIGLLFGIGWAFWLVMGHESIHKSLEERATERRMSYGLIPFLEDGNAHAHSDKQNIPEETKHIHAEERSEREDNKSNTHKHGETEDLHDDPIMKLSHSRLLKGHVHAMGLGLLTIAVCLVLAFTSSAEKIKLIASVSTGLGGIIYPFAWILMGYRTPSLGPDAAESSVIFIAGPGIALILLGIFTAINFTLKDIFSKKSKNE